MLLKDIPGVLPSLFDTPISRSKLWERAAESIIPHQLAALSARHQDSGPNIDVYLEHLVNQARNAVACGLLPETLPLVQYRRPRDIGILSTDFVAGMSGLSGTAMRAALFGLEMDLSLDRLVMLSYEAAAQMSKTERAATALRAQVRSISSNLAFWHAHPRYSIDHGPLRGFATDVYANFGMSWNALRLAYKRMIPAHF